MKPPDLLEVSAGLRVTHIGFRILAWAVLLSALTTAVHAIVHYLDSWFDFLAMAGGGCCVTPLSIVGTLVTFSGQLRCLDTPAELPVARSRIRLAVILEGCGLLSGVVNLGVAAVYSGSRTVPLEVLWASFVFSLVLLVAGRVFFLAYLLAVARAAGQYVTFRPPIAVVMVIVSFAAVVAVVVNIKLPADIQARGLIVMGGCFVGVTVTLTGLYVYDHLLRRVREAVERFPTEAGPADERLAE